MLKVLIDCGGHPAIFTLPHNQLEVSGHLLSAGFQDPHADLVLNGEYSPDSVGVKLVAETSIDNWLQSLFSENARLSTVNTVCDLFYSLSLDQQIDLTHRMADGHIGNEKDLLDAIKDIKAAPSHDLPPIIFSRVRLWTDTGEDCEFFMGGVPKSYEDLEDNADCIDFGEFVEQLSTGHSKEITAYVTAFSEGSVFEEAAGEPQPASPQDIERIYNAIADVDIDTITGWTWHGDGNGRSTGAFNAMG